MKKPSSKLTLALCGLGAAGKARLEAIHRLTDIELKGIVSRREEVATLTWEQALLDPNLDAIAISTENTTHANLTRQALAAGKHVLCDYPLAFSATEARELFDLAQAQGKVLHVEHIGLLTSAHKKAKDTLASMGDLREGRYAFQGSWNDKLANAQHTGPTAILSFSRLMQIADLFGMFRIESSFQEIGNDHFNLELTLLFPQGGQMTFSEFRKSGLKRKREMKIRMEKGDYEWEAEVGSENLFLQDLIQFKDRVLSNRACYYDEALIPQILSVLEPYLMKKGSKEK